MHMQKNKVYVGNLSYEATQTDLQDYFGQFGEVTDVKVITDRESGRSKGFAFVQFADDDMAQAAIDGAQNAELKGRKMNVNLAREKSEGGRGGSRF